MVPGSLADVAHGTLDLMSADPSVIEALEIAVRADPTALEVRLHLLGLLVAENRWDTALVHTEVLVAELPADPRVLTLAAAVFDALGRGDRADAYRRLVEALQDPPAPEGQSYPNEYEAPAPATDQATGMPVGDVPIDDVPGDDVPREGIPVIGVPVMGDLPPDTGIGSDPGTGALDPLLESAIDSFLDEVLLEADASRITLADVGGLSEVKKRLETSFLVPMRNPDLQQMYGKSLRGGLLLYGPPGCGKTFLARAVAGELGAAFISVALTDVFSMWFGESERNVHEIFEEARRRTPCVLFLDEVDAIGQKRAQQSYSAGRNSVAQLLTEMDGANQNNDGVFVLAATNQPWDLDSALRRPGRLDRMLLVLPPDADARVAILEHHLAGRPVGQVDLVAIAKMTDGFSGADLNLVCESAAETALLAAVETNSPRPISQRDLLGAVAGITASTRSWLEVARNFVTFANSDGIYDDLLAYLRQRRML